MSTTTLRLPEAVKERIERLASAQGKSAHALMIDTLDAGTAALERRLDFEAEAARRWKHMQRTGEYLTHEDLRDYAMALARGEKPARPQPRTMAPDELARLRARARRADRS
jgi:predicted transcriptional regulator